VQKPPNGELTHGCKKEKGRKEGDQEAQGREEARLVRCGRKAKEPAFCRLLSFFQ
jgi:hypothetical protein